MIGVCSLIPHILIGSVIWLINSNDCSWAVSFTYASIDYYDNFLDQKSKPTITNDSANTMWVMSQPTYVPWTHMADYVPQVRPPNVISFKIGYGYPGSGAQFIPCPGEWTWQQEWSTSLDEGRLAITSTHVRTFWGRPFCQEKGRNWFNISMEKDNITLKATLPVDIKCDDFPSPNVTGLRYPDVIWTIGTENTITYLTKGYNKFVNSYSSAGIGIYSQQLEIINSSGRFEFLDWGDLSNFLGFVWDEYTVTDLLGNFTRIFSWKPKGQPGAIYTWCVKAAYAQPPCAFCANNTRWTETGNLYNQTESLCTKITLKRAKPTHPPSEQTGSITAVVVVLSIFTIGTCCMAYYKRETLYRMMHKSEYQELL